VTNSLAYRQCDKSILVQFFGIEVPFLSVEIVLEMELLSCVAYTRPIGKQ